MTSPQLPTFVNRLNVPNLTALRVWAKRQIREQRRRERYRRSLAYKVVSFIGQSIP